MAKMDVARTLEPQGNLQGQILGGLYRALRPIGSGGMAVVYAGEHVRLGRRVALKVVQPQYAQRSEVHARLVREAKAASRIRSPHTIEVHDLVDAPDGRACMVTEYLAGQDLQAVLERRRRLPPELALDLSIQIADGLRAAHARGIVHRDIKPANIFLVQEDTELRAKIVDFGVAKFAEPAAITCAGAVVGTPCYMAPEQARGASHADERADVYSAAAVLYRMVTGRPPYPGGADANTTLARLLSRPPPAPAAVRPSLPSPLCAVVERGMARDPEDRYATSSTWREALVECRHALGKPQVGELSQLAAYVGRRALQWSGGCALLLSAAAAIRGDIPLFTAAIYATGAIAGAHAYRARTLFFQGLAPRPSRPGYDPGRFTQAPPPGPT